MQLTGSAALLLGAKHSDGLSSIIGELILA